MVISVMKKIPYCWSLLLLGGFCSIQAKPPVKLERFRKIYIVALDNKYFEAIGGYPAISRKSFLPLFDKLKRAKPRILHFDGTFSRMPTKDESNFAVEMNKGIAFTSNLIITDEPIEVNYENNLVSIGHKIIAWYSSAPHSDAENGKGIILPYPEFVNTSRGIFLSVYPGSYSNYEMLFFMRYKKHIYPNANICLINDYLTRFDLRFELTKDLEELRLLKKPNTKLAIWALRAISYKPLTYPLGLIDIPVYSALDILSNKIYIENDAIIFVGITAHGGSSLVWTPHGTKHSVEILANEFNTLWNLAKDELPASERK